MAWSDACKVPFQIAINKKITVDDEGNRRGVNQAIRELSEEGDIPFNTLKRWYYEGQPEPEVAMPEESSIKNEPVEKQPPGGKRVVKKPREKEWKKALTRIYNLIKQGAIPAFVVPALKELLQILEPEVQADDGTGF